MQRKVFQKRRKLHENRTKNYKVISERTMGRAQIAKSAKGLIEEEAKRLLEKQNCVEIGLKATKLLANEQCAGRD
jgi:hypothetical protein